MIPNRKNPFHGIYPATIVPYRRNFAIDEAALADHFAAMAKVKGNVGLLVNGHAGDNYLLSRAEKRRVIEIARETVGDRLIVVSGINAEFSLEAAEHARDAEAAGADAIMVFGPYSWALGQDAGMAVTHHRLIGEACGLPMFLFQGSVNAGHTAYRLDVLERLVKLPRVVGIKEGSWEIARYEANLRLVRRVAPNVGMMGSGDEHIFHHYVSGSDGSLVSISVVIPKAVCALYEAFKKGDLKAARRANEIIYPLAKTIYGTAPGAHVGARLRACMKILGTLKSERVRPPVGALPKDEIRMLERALKAAGVG